MPPFKSTAPNAIQIGCESTKATQKGCIFNLATYIGCEMTRKTRKIAVLTGDLVGSTALGPEKVEQAFAALENCAHMQAEWMGGQSLHFTRHRGDGWQVALEEPKYALRSALCFRACLRALGAEFDTYIGHAEGDAPHTLPQNLNSANSDVFFESGTMLEAVKLYENDQKLGHAAMGYQDAAFVLADYISAQWTTQQATAIQHMLLRLTAPSYTQLAQTLGKYRQSVTKSLDGAGYKFILSAIDSIEMEDEDD